MLSILRQPALRLAQIVRDPMEVLRPSWSSPSKRAVSYSRPKIEMPPPPKRSVDRGSVTTRSSVVETPATNWGMSRVFGTLRNPSLLSQAIGAAIFVKLTLLDARAEDITKHKHLWDPEQGGGLTKIMVQDFFYYQWPKMLAALLLAAVAGGVAVAVFRKPADGDAEIEEEAEHAVEDAVEEYIENDFIQTSLHTVNNAIQAMDNLLESIVRHQKDGNWGEDEERTVVMTEFKREETTGLFHNFRAADQDAPTVFFQEAEDDLEGVDLEDQTELTTVMSLKDVMDLVLVQLIGIADVLENQYQVTGIDRSPDLGDQSSVDLELRIGVLKGHVDAMKKELEDWQDDDYRRFDAQRYANFINGIILNHVRLLQLYQDAMAGSGGG